MAAHDWNGRRGVDFKFRLSEIHLESPARAQIAPANQMPISNNSGPSKAVFVGQIKRKPLDMSTWNESLLTAGSTEMPHGKDDVNPDLCSETEEYGRDQCLSVLAVCASVILWTIWALEASSGTICTRKSFKMANPELVLTCWDEYSVLSIRIWDEPAEVGDSLACAACSVIAILGQASRGNLLSTACIKHKVI